MTAYRRWFVGVWVGCSLMASAQNLTFTSYPVSGPPTSIAVGSDGALWFVEGGFSASTITIGRLTTTGTLTEFPTAVGTGAGCIAQIITGPDGNLWVSAGNALGPGTFGPVVRVNTSGAITGTFQTPQSSSCVLSMTNGPDGAIWATEAVASGDKIARISTAGVFTNQYNVPEGGGAVNPSMIVTGSDGNLWFTGVPFFRIGTVTTSGAFNDRLLPGIMFNGVFYTGPTGDSPFGITSGPDGAIWFTEEGQSFGPGAAPSKIGRITTGGVISEFPTPTPNSVPYAITTGPDGALWFTEVSANKIGRITTGGTITEIPVTTGSTPAAIVLGPDGAFWFTEGASNRIVRAAITAATPPPPPGVPAPPTILLALLGLAVIVMFMAGRTGIANRA